MRGVPLGMGSLEDVKVDKVLVESADGVGGRVGVMVLLLNKSLSDGVFSVEVSPSGAGSSVDVESEDCGSNVVVGATVGGRRCVEGGRGGRVGRLTTGDG